MNFEFLRNPIVLGGAAFLAVYMYLYWQNEKENKDKTNNNPKSVDLMIPFVAGLAIWFLAWMYMSNSTPVATVDPLPIKSSPQIKSGGIIEPSTLLDSAKPIPKSSIRLPQTDVFIDIAKF